MQFRSAAADCRFDFVVLVAINCVGTNTVIVVVVGVIGVLVVIIFILVFVLVVVVGVLVVIVFMIVIAVVVVLDNTAAAESSMARGTWGLWRMAHGR